MAEQSLNEAEINHIRGEIEGVIKGLIEGCVTLNMEKAFDLFHDSPDFLMMGTDGSLCSYAKYLKNNVDYLNSCSAFKLKTFRGETRVLDQETAIYAWAYRAEATLKTGERDIVENAGASFIFKRIHGEWKAVYYHESSTPPGRVEMNKQ